MRLPEPNRYLAENLKLKPVDLNLVLEHPIRVLGEPAGELFYKRDFTFGRPEAHAYFRITSHRSVLPPREMVCLELLVSVTNRQALLVIV